ncbi:MAG: hypothetical protein AAF253_09175 [Pseudomonadota bacterium]
MGPRTRKLRRVMSALIASGVAWIVGEAYVGKPLPGMEADALGARFEEAASLRFPGS